MRQDVDTPGFSKATAWVGRLLQASGIDAVITLDMHSARAAELLPLPAVSLSPAPLFVEAIVEADFTDAVVVAPDDGATARAETVRNAAGIAKPLVVVEKTRTRDGVQSTLQGNAGPRAIVVDDMLDTGGTLLACCEALRHAGTEAMLILVTHGLFTGDAWQRLWEFGVERIYCTNSLPQPETAHDSRIRVLSIAPMLARYFAGEKHP